MSADKYSLSAKVFEQLQEDILSGRYKKDEELKEKTLGEIYGVSRTPVREALRQLELEGLVSMIPNKGARVEGFSPEDIHDIYEIRSMLEGLCAKWAARKATPDMIAKLEEIIYLTDFHTEKGHAKQVYEMDNQFHEKLYEAGGSKVLAHLLNDYHRYVQRVRKASLKSQERSVKSTAEHAAIVKAIKDHDEEQAQKLANAHIMNSIKNIEHYGLEHMTTSEVEKE